MGIIQGYYNEDEKKLYIEMMTVNPKLRRQGINSHMIRFLRNKLGLSQDDIIFDKPTEMGKKFMQGKKY
jgi:ribosomal protein S18 acetylase RimI-like enzyme